MNMLNKMSLKQKITALILAPSCLVLLLSSSIFVGSQVITYKRLTVSELNAVAGIIASNVSAAVIFDDPASAEEMLRVLGAKPGLVWARILLPDGSLFAAYEARPGVAGESVSATWEYPDSVGDSAGDSAGGETTEHGQALRLLDSLIDLRMPIHLDGETIGTLLLRADLAQMYDIIDSYLVLAAFVVFLLIAVAFVMASRIQKVVTEPVLGLLKTMQAVSSEQDYTIRARKHADDELGEVSDGFNRMLAEIQAHDLALRAAWHEADAASRAKTEFLANMSHELRTPLNAIIGFSEIIKLEMLGPLGIDRYGHYAQDIFDSGNHLLAVIGDILDISKVEAGEFELHAEPTELEEIAAQSLRLVRERAEAAGIRIEVAIDPDLPQLLLDQRLIKQSLINLLSNAIKFSPEDGRVALQAVRGPEGSVLLSVADSGIGIAEDEIPSVLQPFSQVESAFSRSHEGTGLGLPLAKSFIEAHGGRLEIDSTVGRGTRVTLHIPPQRAIEAPRPDIAAQPAE
jgi:signal transduction histidine kinase